MSGETEDVVLRLGAGFKLDGAEKRMVPVLCKAKFVCLIEERQNR